MDWICVVLVRFWEYDELLKMLVNMLLILCFCVVLSAMMYRRPVNVFVNHFGWLGDQNWVFGWKWGLKPRILKKPVRLSERQASCKRTKTWLSTLCLLKRSSRRLSERPKFCPEPVACERRSSERQASLKRGTSQLTWIGSLKRVMLRLSEVGPVRPFFWISLRA